MPALAKLAAKMKKKRNKFTKESQQECQLEWCIANDDKPFDCARRRLNVFSPVFKMVIIIFERNIMNQRS
jgi:hypothetical protein